MRRLLDTFAADMSIYIHQLRTWPQFKWDNDVVVPLLGDVRYMQGKVLGRMETLGFDVRMNATLQNITLDVVKSNEIEGQLLDPAQVRSSIARRLGIDIAGTVPADRYVDGIVEMMLDATQGYNNTVTEERLFGWQAALFPTGRSGMHKITVGAWRNNAVTDPMQVVSGPMNRETVHFEAPVSGRLAAEMERFILWLNEEMTPDPVLKAAIAHLWFVTIHPFDDGNGRITRAITDMLLARADGTPQRYYSMSAQILQEKKGYYTILETTQKGDMDITGWLHWFLTCLQRAIAATNDVLETVLTKAKFWDRHTHTTLNERQKYMLNKLLDGFDGKLNTSKWGKMTKVSQDTALRDIQDLVDKQVLAKEEAGGRSTNYLLLL